MAAAEMRPRPDCARYSGVSKSAGPGTSGGGRVGVEASSGVETGLPPPPSPFPPFPSFPSFPPPPFPPPPARPPPPPPQAARDRSPARAAAARYPVLIIAKLAFSDRRDGAGGPDVPPRPRSDRLVPPRQAKECRRRLEPGAGSGHAAGGGAGSVKLSARRLARFEAAGCLFIPSASGAAEAAARIADGPVSARGVRAA